MNVPEFHAGQGILLSTKGYIIQWLFNNLRGFFYMMLVFLLVKKKKKRKRTGSQLVTSLALCHFHPGNVFCPDSPGRKVKCPSFIWRLFLGSFYNVTFFEHSIQWSLAPDHSPRSHRSPSQEKVKGISTFSDGNLASSVLSVLGVAHPCQAHSSVKLRTLETTNWNSWAVTVTASC